MQRIDDIYPTFYKVQVQMKKRLSVSTDEPVYFFEL